VPNVPHNAGPGEICLNIKLTTKTWGSEISWAFGSCSGNNYGNHQVYDTECCQPAGDYTLTCTDSYGDGWHGGYIQVGSSPARICENFRTGSSQTQTVAHTPPSPLPPGTVCTTIKLTTQTWGSEISWDFGSCSRGRIYGNNQVYTTECCQPAGDYTLTCKDSYGDGWHGGYIQVGSSPAKTCYDFRSGTTQSQTINHPNGAQPVNRK